MNTANIEDIYELSPVQQGILFHCLYAPELPLYFLQASHTLHGQLNVVAFDRAWQEVAARHTALRTSFYWENIDKPLQVVNKQVKVPLDQQDWRGIDTQEQQRRLKSFLESDRNQGFNFSQESIMMRLSLIRLGDQSYQFVWSSHHIILDGWSTALIFKEFVLLYQAFSQGEDISLESGSCFGDYIAWLQQQNLSQAEIFWQQTLSKFQTPTPLTNLEIDGLSSQEEKYDEERIKLSAITTAALKSLAQQHKLTLNTLFQGAWAILLSRYSCHKDVVYGCTVSGRPVDIANIESVVGMFINTLPVRIYVDPEQFLLPWLQQLQVQQVEMRQYEYSPLVQVQGCSQVSRGLPLFNSILVFENYPVDQMLKEWQGDIKVENTIAFYKTNYPLTVPIYPGSQMKIGISYDCRRFDLATITGILIDFQILLQSMVTNPDVRLQDLSLFTPIQQELSSILDQQVTFDFDFAKQA